MHLSRLKWLLTPLAAIVLITGLVTARQTRRVDQNALKNARQRRRVADLRSHLFRATLQAL